MKRRMPDNRRNWNEIASEVLSIKGIVYPKMKIHVAANTWDYCHFYKLFGFQQAHFSGNKQIIYIYLQKSTMVTIACAKTS